MKIRTQRVTAYFMAVFTAVNSIWMTVYPTLSYAETVVLTPAEKAKIKASMNTGQWDGALMIKQFALPTLNTDDEPIGLNVDTGEYEQDDAHYTDSTKKHLKNEVYLQQLFPNYNKADLDEYVSNTANYVVDPEFVQDELAVIQDDIDFYAGQDCESLDEQEEITKCERSQLLSALDGMKNNDGKSLFGGANDSILQDTSDLLDGTHPYFSDLYNEECKEIVREGEAGDAIVPVERRTCMVHSTPPKASCKAERFMETEYVATKTVMSYTSEGDYKVLRSSMTDVTPCEGEVNCLLVDIKPGTKYHYRPLSHNVEGSHPNMWGQYGAEIKFAPGINIVSAQLVTLNSQMSLYPLDPNNQGHVATEITTSQGYIYHDNPCFTLVEAIPYDYPREIPEHNVCERRIVKKWELNEILPDSPLDLDIEVFKLTSDGVLNIFSNVYDNITVYKDIESYESLYFDSSHQIKIYFENETIYEGDLEIETIISTPVIDDIEEYPMNSVISILGEPLKVTVDVFDEDIYPSAQHVPTNYQVTGDTVTSFKVIDHGRATNKWRYQIELELSEIAPFKITVDLHKVIDQGIRPIEGEDYCQPVIDSFIESTFPATASCDYSLGEHINEAELNPTGLVFNESTLGYLNLMQGWGDNGEPPLEKLCWEATIVVDPSSGVGISADDKSLSCAGLEGEQHENCMAGSWCTYDDLNGQEVCYDTENGLRLGFADACASYIENPACEYMSNETLCEEWGEDETGARVCLYESHIFNCDIETSGYGIPAADETDTICGGPVSCMNGECTNLKKEGNESFAKAAAMQQLAEEVSRNNNCVVNEENAGSCKLFGGDAGTCKQPHLWGAQDCCDPDALGMGGMDVVAYWKIASYMETLTQNDAGAGWLSQSWTGASDFVLGTAEAPTAMGSAYQSVADPVSGAVNTLMEPLKTGFNSFVETIGFDPIFETTATLAEEAAVQATNAAQASASSLNGVVVESSFSGIYQYIAQGVYDFINLFAPEFAKMVFSTGVTAAGASTGEVTGWAEGLLGDALGSIFTYLNYAMMIYAIYNLVIGLVYGCEEEDFAAAQKIKLLSNHYVGSYCSQKTLFGCSQHSQQHCLYGSPFSRIMAEQIRIQLAEDSGESVTDIWIMPGQKKTKEPNCTGFTLDQINAIDWDRVDLTEFLQIIMAKMKYDPNNMPGDFNPSEAGAGGRTGPHSSITSIESNIAAIKAVANVNDDLKQNLATHNMEMNNPEYMPFYSRSAPSNATGCTLTCNAEFFYNSASGTCEQTETISVSGSKSCNTGEGYIYNVSEDLCVKEVTTPLSTGCPKAYVLNEDTGMCEGTAYSRLAADIACDVGFSFNSTTNQCQKMSVIDTVSDCSIHGEGWIFEEGLCVLSSTQNVPPLKQCPNSDYLLLGDACVYNATLPYSVTCEPGELFDALSGECQFVSEIKHAVIKNCPNGFNLENDACVKVETGSATMVCDIAEGWSLDGNRCIKIVTHEVLANKGCPSGYTVNDDYTGCEKYEIAVNDEPDCEAGWTISSTQGYCYKDISESQPATYKCNLGYSYNASLSQCEKITRYPVSYNCDTENDFFFDASTVSCVKHSQEVMPANKSCDLPSVLVNGMCETPTIGNLIYECPVNFVYNSTTQLCDRFEVQYSDPTIDCPDGYDVRGDECLSTVVVEASKSCPPTSILNVETNNCEVILPIVEDMTPTCPAGFKVVGQTCIGRNVIDAEATCLSEGYEYDEYDKKCFIDVADYIESLQLCPEGSPENLAGLCKSRVVKEPIYECPLGYHYSQEVLTCISQVGEYVDALVTCETDWIYDVDLNICTFNESYEGVTCEDGFVFNDLLGQCTQVITMPASPYCQDGYAFDGASCIKVEHSLIICELGFEYDELNKVCHKTESIPATIVCEQGFTLVDDVCVNNETLPPICPDNYQYDEALKLCLILEVVEAEKSCPSGYYYDGIACAKLLTAIATCEDGLVYDPETSLCSSSSYPLEEYCSVGIDSGSDCRVREQKIPTCDVEGYFYNTETQFCEKEETIIGTPYCQLSEIFSVELYKDRCAYYTFSATLENEDCQEGYQLRDELCIRYEEFTDPLYECPSDYSHILDNEGYEILISPTCIKLNQELPVCDTLDLYTFVGGFCEKYHITPYQNRCLVEGEYQYGAACLSGDVDSLQCPSAYGYSRENDRCEFIELLSVSLSCTSPYVLFEGECKSSATVNPDCETNHVFDSVSGLCEPIIMSPTCPNGYIYNVSLDKCEFRQEVPANGDCPVGSFEQGAGCIAFHEARCNEGYTLDVIQDQCIKIEEFTPTEVCELGSIDTGSGCIKEHAPNCTSGYVYSSINKRCENFQVTIPSKTCDPQFEDVGDGCLAVSSPNCNTGYSFVPSNDRCEKVISTAANASCPSGYTDVGGDCLKTAMPTCSNGYLWVPLNDRCEKFQSAAILLECPFGSNEIGGECWLTRAPKCNNGYSLDTSSDMCIKEEQQSANLSCSNGYFYSGGLCYSYQSPTCSSGYNYDSATDTCRKQLVAPASGKCPVGHTDTGTDCRKVTVESASCPPGTTLNTSSDKCEGQGSSTGYIRCNSGFSYVSSSKKCEKTEFASVSCPSGSSWHSASQSCRSFSAKYCRPPRGDQELLTATPNSSGMCVYQNFYPRKTITSPALCPGGTTPTDNDPLKCYSQSAGSCPPGFNNIGNQCKRVVVQTPTCSVGSFSSGTCTYSTSTAPICSATLTYNTNYNNCRKGVNTPYSEFECAAGWNIVGDSCYKWDSQQPSCSSGFSYSSSNNRCEANNGVAANAGCPSGWTTIGNNCYRTRTHSPICTPPYGYDSNSNRCEATVMPSATCADGWIHNASQNRCERTLVGPPNCASGLSYNASSNRCEGGSIDFDYSCDAGWTLSGANCEKTVVQPPNCPADSPYESSSNRCVGDKVGYTLSCGPSWTLVGETCNKLSTHIPDCNSGFMYIAAENICRSSELGYDLECPDGWILNGETCERTLVHDPICDPGFSYNTDSDRCESDTLNDFEYSCDNGWVLEDTICFKYNYDDPSCNAAYIFENDVCSPFIEKPQIATCPALFELDGTACNLQQYDYPNCESPYQLSPQADQCSEATISIMGFQCPQGWSLVGMTCEMEVGSGEQITCGEGFTFNEETSQCMKTEYAYPVYICPAGYDRMEDERTCRKIVEESTDPIGMSCPYEGFELQGDECVLVFNIQLASYCEDPSRSLVPTPVDIILDPEITTEFACMKVTRIFEDANFECPVDYSPFAVSFCSIPTETDLLYTCINPDLSPNFDNMTCTGYSKIIVGKLIECLSGGDQVGGTCVTYGRTQPTLTCPSADQIYLDGTCRASLLVESVPPYPSCNNGMTPDGEVCSGISLSYPSYTCELAGYEANEVLGVCVKNITQNAMAIQTCNIGGSIVDGMCLIVQTEQAVYGCPTTAWNKQGGLCTREFTQTKTATVCLTGDVLIGNLCYSVLSTSFVDGCFDGQVYDAAAGVCRFDNQIYSDPIAVCANADFTPYGLICKKTTVNSVLKTCNDLSFSIVGDYCYEEIVTGSTPEYGCSEPYSDTGSECAFSDSATVDITCPVHYLYNGTLDVCEAVNQEKKSALYNCPDDYLKLDNFKCEKMIATLPPIYSCEEADGQLNGNQCVKKEEISQVQGFCEPPFQMSGGTCLQKFTETYDMLCPVDSVKNGNECFVKTVTTEVPIQVCD